ncbi:hypothetical protein Q5738_00465 [Citrobacter werkmanii]|uniref:hypothetical protein n=1 Tax=Citrobacter werkmanii TaxID=67827 RepID=UPI0027193174|nr:hypothetical protein [Citrobacter werkmanii]MDO8232058.1 hypothetical protein [Citrobacter werkmanii]
MQDKSHNACVAGGTWSHNPIYPGMRGLQLDFVFYVSSLAGVLVAPLFMLMAAIDDTIRA